MDVLRDWDRVTIATEKYRLVLSSHSPEAVLTDAAAGPSMRLMLLSALTTERGRDGTLAIAAPEIEEFLDCTRVRIAADSTLWDTKRVVLDCRPDEVAVRFSVRGTGRLTDVRLLGGTFTGNPRWGGGSFHSAWQARTLFCPSPDDPKRVLASAAEPAAIGVIGGSMPGRGHWFFTPAPYLVAGSKAEVDDPDDPRGAPWTAIGLRARLAEATFTELRYEPFLGGFSLSLDYDGQTAVEGAFTTPELVVRPGIGDPYAAIAEHARRLREDGRAPTVPRDASEWWGRPIFCGWGEQFRQARRTGTDPTTWSRQAEYDRWLAILHEQDVVPGTITIDDKWQRTYGRNEVNAEAWPDLHAWISERHAARQRVLLWFKAWDPEGLPAEACVTDRLGQRIAADPESDSYRKILRESVHRMLSSDGLDADGLKVDFTAQTPAGPGLRHAGQAWGATLLHRLLALVYGFAKEAKPDALVVTHTPSPLFADVTDMIRLNDLLRLSDAEPLAPAVPQMRHRARIARAVDDGWLIDTDDWCMPSKAEWRAYLAVKPELGVPALYYATGIDHSDEAFDANDYAAIREEWQRWEARRLRGRRS